MLMVDACILAVSATGKKISYLESFVQSFEAILTQATILEHRGSQSSWRMQPEMCCEMGYGSWLFQHDPNMDSS